MSEQQHPHPPGPAFTLLVVSLLAASVQPSLGLCETRCERSIRILTELRELWSRSFKRVGNQDVSFDRFLISMLYATNRSDNPALRRLRHQLLLVIARYQDCVMACEHQFSKRSDRSRPRSPPSVVLGRPRKRRFAPFSMQHSNNHNNNNNNHNNNNAFHEGTKHVNHVT